MQALRSTHLFIILNFLCSISIIARENSLVCSNSRNAYDCSEQIDEAICCDKSYFCRTFLLPRSQASDMGRRLLARHFFINNYEKNGYTNTVVNSNVYTQSFNEDKTGSYFSPRCGSNSFTFGFENGSNIDVRAEDFGFSCTGQITLCPKYQAWTTEISLFFLKNPCDLDIFIDIHIPIVHIEWDNQCCVKIIQDCAQDFACGLMSVQPSDTQVGTTNPSQAFSGQFLWGDVQAIQEFGQFRCGKEDPITRVAEIEIGIGTWIAAGDWWNLGLKVVGKIPTGNHSSAQSLLDPIAGNGGYPEVGIGIGSYALLCEWDTNKKLMLNIAAQATHLFSREQVRIFDLANNKCFSRYLLLKQFKNNGTEYDCLERGPNIFTKCINTKINAQIDAAIILSYLHNCYLFDIGYNFWGRSEEKISKFCATIQEQAYGIKGTLPVIAGELVDGECEVSGNPNIQTASLSTINTTKGKSNGTDGTLPTFLKTSDLNLCSALAPKAQSHAFLGNFAWIWPDHELEPFFGFGGKVELSIYNSALDQWAFWFRGGMNF
jgi:hypothetical protein